MKLLQNCWTALLELLNLSTFSTTGGSSFQQALQQPDHPVPLPGHGANVHALPKLPIFSPPSRPENPDSVIQCDYSAMGPQWVPCSSSADRNCWLKGPKRHRFDIKTDYETSFPKGIIRRYDLTTAGNYSLNADGLVMPYAKLFNNSYPGPWIQACWGDIIEIKVHNKLKFNGTTVHWHGLRQNQSTEMDGVNAVSQCPIAPGDSFTYRFRATQYGTSWYHSHYSLQYGDGLLGPMTIHGPSSTEYDEGRDPLLMTDWNHRSGFQEFVHELNPPPAPMDSILLNGHGSYAGGGNCGYKFNTTFERGKKYLLRLINTSVSTTFVFTIDNHNLTVITSDFVPIHPYITDHVVVGIGQRYHVVVEASPKDGSGKKAKAKAFWMRTIPADGCSGFPLGGQPDERQGIIYYEDERKLLPISTRNNYTGYNLACRDESPENLVPIIPWEIGKPSNAVNNDPEGLGQFGESFGIGLQNPDQDHGRPLPNDSFRHWAMGDKPMWLNFSDPTIHHLDNKTFNPEYVVIPEDYPEDAWIYYLITADPHIRSRGVRGDIPASHPMHLHGHDFALLQQSKHNTTVNPPKPNLHNPPRRDVVLLPSGGYVIIAFKADNPGIWIFHCHIAMHASSGLAVQILERAKQAQRQLSRAALKESKRVCDNWKTWVGNPDNHWPGKGKPHDGVFQEDSGI